MVMVRQNTPGRNLEAARLNTEEKFVTETADAIRVVANQISMLETSSTYMHPFPFNRFRRPVLFSQLGQGIRSVFR
jgi:hypothetical protein